MPRDKSESHERVVEAAKKEFLEHGFNGASMRSIGEKAGMTCAGLYRHYKNKEDMYDDLVKPAIDSIRSWYTKHVNEKYNDVDNGAGQEKLFDQNVVDFVRKEVYEHEIEFKLLLNCSKGSKYENFVHQVVNKSQNDFMEALDYMKTKGFKIKDISKEEMHIIMSAYMTALFEPFVHEYPKDKLERYLQTIEDFFMPGWKNIMGF